MERFTTFKDNELHLALYTVYAEIIQSVECGALLHIRTLKDNNPYHFEHMVEYANKAIEGLRQFYPNDEKMLKEFALLDINELLKQAVDFLTDDIY